MSISTDLQAVYDNLQTVLADCNTALTGKGGAEAEALAGVAAAITDLPSGGGGAELPALTNPAADSDVVSGKEYIDQSGAKRTGTLTSSLAAGVAEMESQVFTPEADTNEALTFSLSMNEMPTHIMIVADFPTPVARSFVSFYGGHSESDSSGDGTNYMDGNILYCAGASFSKTSTTADSSNTNRSGVWNLTNNGFTFRGNYYGGQFTYFRAGYTYTIIAMRVVPL